MGAHQKRAPTTFSQPLVGLGSHYSLRHKSFSYLLLVLYLQALTNLQIRTVDPKVEKI
jgi:hypothetical protein